jgi:hypothetical protein
LDWRAKAELYEQIRREYEFGVASVIGVARKLGVHRRMVREAVRNAVPTQRKKTERPAVKMASIAQNCKALRLPSVGAQFASLAEEAAQRKHSHLHYLEALLQSGMEDRERRSIGWRMKEAHLPRVKTLEEFDSFSRRTSPPPASVPWPKAANVTQKQCPELP